MAGVGRPRLPLEEKIRRGTVEVARESRYNRGGDPPDPPATPPPAERRDYEAIARAYVDGVLDGSVVASRFVRLACRRQRDDEGRVNQPAFPYVWEPRSWGSDACWFVECCPHVEGTWERPTILLEPWQVFLVLSLFGWRQKAHRARRRFTAFYLEVARKAAKSTLMAAVAYFHLLKENEPGASVICGATTGAQARMVFDIMRKMALRSPWLKEQGVNVMANSITTADGAVRPVNSKATSLDGLNPSCIILDESHAQDYALHNVLKSAQGARDNPLLLCPTTAGYDLTSVGYGLRGQVIKVLEGIYQADHLLGAIYAIDDEDDWRDEACWLKANPMIGVSPKWDYMRRFCADSQQVGGNEGEFLVKACSRWGSGHHAWLQMLLWDRCGEAGLTMARFTGQRCWMGGDLAAVDDIAALAWVFREGDVVYGFVRGYLPEEVVAERARLVPAYRAWVASGELRTTEGSMTDLNVIEADIRASCLAYDVRQVIFDQYASAQLASKLAASGIKAAVQPKTAKVTTVPMRSLEAWVKHVKFRHDASLMLKWFASNVHVRFGTDDTLLPKKDSPESPNKIDGMDALLSAIGAMLADVGSAPKVPQIIILGGKPYAAR